MSPSPTFRATSTSRYGSRVYDARPSTSDGSMPASSSAIDTAWQASDSSLSARPFPNSVCPMPTTAVLFLIRSPARATRSPALPGRWPALAERSDALLRVDGRRVELDEHRLLFQQVAARELRRVVQQLLRPAERLRRPGREPLRPLLRGRLQLRGGHDLVDDPEGCRVLRGEVVTEEDELLRLVHADDARQEVGGTAVGDEPAAHEHLDQSGVVGRDHQVGCECEHRAATGCGAVQCDDDRLLAVLYRLH